ncbi:MULTISPECIES: hypothetical protein [unclassified Blastococcus]
MTVLMTPNQQYMLAGGRCRIEWQGLSATDDVSARLVTAGGPLVFPRDTTSGLRQQPFSPKGTWLLDLDVVEGDVKRIDLLVEPRTSSALSLAVEVAGAEPGVIAQVLQHPGITTVAGAPMLVLRLERRGETWTAVPYDGAFVDASGEESGSIPVPGSLREPAVLARRVSVARRGETITAVVDLSASMRPRLLAGTVAGVLTGLQAIAGAADQRTVQVVGVSDRAHGPRALDLADDAESFLRQWVGEIGFRTGVRGTTEQWIATQVQSGLVVSISDQEPDEEPVTAAVTRRCVVLTAPDANAAPGPHRPGTVVLSEPTPAPGTVITALARASAAS